MAEGLESRVLLAAEIVNLGGVQTLSVTGSAAAETVTFRVPRGGRLEVFLNGARHGGEFHTDKFSQIRFDLQGGNDTLTHVPVDGKPVTYDGGTGDVDRIQINTSLGDDLVEVSAGRVSGFGRTYNYSNVEDVIVSDSGGGDTLRLLASAGTGTANVSLLGGGGNDTFDANVPWTGDLYFNGDAGNDLLIAHAETHYDYRAGDNDDRLQLITTNATDRTSITEYYADVWLPGQTTVPVRGVNHYNLEQIDLTAGPSGAASGAVHTIDVAVASPNVVQLNVAGSADADHVKVNTSTFGPTSARLNFIGGAGADRLEMQNGARLLGGFDGGPAGGPAGADEDVLVFSGTDAADLIAAYPHVTYDAVNRVDTAGVERVELRGQAGNDRFEVTPGTDTTFSVQAHPVPAAATGDAADVMHVRPAGATPTRLTYTTGTTHGQVTFADRKPILFADVDDIDGLEEGRPVANPGGPYQVVEGKSVVLDGTASTPFEGSTLTYSWDFDYDGVSFTPDATGARPTFSAFGLNHPLVRTVRLRVTDAGNRTSFATTTVTLTPTQVPVANANGPYEVFVNNTVTLSGNGSYDPDGFIRRYEWDYDYDGVTFDVDSSTSYHPAFNATGRPPGVRTLGLRVVDDSGIRSPVATTTLTVKASPPPTVNAGGPYATVERGSVTVRGTGTAGTGDWVVRYDWDFDYDGVTFQPQAAHTPSASLTYDHDWDGPSTRSAGVRVVTQQGQTAIATVPIAVTNVAPSAGVTGSTSANEGSPHTLTLNKGTDPGDDTISGWRIDWGDGGVVEQFGPFTTTASHTYPDGPAEHLVKAWVVDEDGEHPAPFPGPAGGTLDPKFGTAGKVTTGFVAGSPEQATKLLRQPDGKLVAVGREVNGNSVALARYRADGTLDTTFGTSGKTTKDLGTSNTVVRAAALLPDGGILVLADYGTDVALMRFTAAGAPDASFDGDGVRIYSSSTFTYFGWPRDMAVLPDGRVRIAGVATNSNYQFAVFSVLADGTPDASFGNDGVRRITLGNVNWTSSGTNIAALPNGQLVVAGATSVGAVFVRLNPDGTVDKSFGAAAGGYVTADHGDNEGVRAMLVQPDGKILFSAEGTEAVNNTSQRIGWLKRLNPDGTPDPTFAGGGRLLMYSGQWAEFAEALALDDAGRIYAAGNSPVLVSPSVLRNQLTAFRITPQGAFDTTFGNGGRVRVNFTSDTRSGWGYDVALVGPRRFVVAGQGDGGTGDDFALVQGLTEANGLVFVENVAPFATLQAPATAVAGTPMHVQFAATDPGDDAVQSWRVDWGDGQIETIAGAASGAAHTYEYGGTRTVRVTATDDDGAVSPNATATVDVAAPPPAVGGDGVLHVRGGDGEDVIALTVNGESLDLLVNGTPYAFPRASVSAVDVRTYGKTDAVTLGAGVPSGAVHLGDVSLADALTVNGPLAGGAAAPLRVTIAGGTVTLAPGATAALATGSATTNLNLGGTEAADAWNLRNNRATGAGGTDVSWTPGTTSTSGGLVSVRVDGLGGADTFDLETSTTFGVNRPAYTIHGGGGADVARAAAGSFTPAGTSASSHGGLTFNGGDDDDTLEAATGVLGSATYFGDAGTDVLIVNGAATADLFSVSDFQVRRSDSPASNSSFSVTGRMVNNTVLPWEDARVYGHGGGDTFSVGSITRPATLLDGGADDDRFNFTLEQVNMWRAPVLLRGAAGTDVVTISDQYPAGNVTAREYALDGTGVRRGAESRHTFDAVEAVTLTAGGGADRFTVTPSDAVQFTVNGGAPDATVTPADKLLLDHAGAVGATLTPGSAAGGGTYAFANRRPIHFTGIEDAAEVTAPTADVVDVAPDPRSTPVDEATVVFTEPVTGFDPVDLRLTRGGAEVPLTGVTVASTDGITYTLAGLSAATTPGGQYVLTVRADGSGIKDAAGNTLAADASDAWFSDAPAPADPPPTVTGVFVSGTAWSPAFRQALATGGLGDAAFGYRIRAADQFNELPWTNVNQISIRFSEPVNVAADDLVVRGVRVPIYSGTYAASPLTYDPVTFTATWQLSQAVAAADKVLLDLDADAGTGVTDAGGRALDGEWPVNVAAVPNFPTGDGGPGGDFRFRMNVLPGDVNRDGGVSTTDLNLVKLAQGAAPGSSLYTPFKDVNGSGTLMANDVSLVRGYQGTTLPAGTPTAPTQTQPVSLKPAVTAKPASQPLSASSRKRLIDGLV